MLTTLPATRCILSNSCFLVSSTNCRSGTFPRNKMIVQEFKILKEISKNLKVEIIVKKTPLAGDI